MNVLANAVLLLASLSQTGPDIVRINLFSLFKPEALQVRIASGGAVLDSYGFAGNLVRGELIYFRLSANRGRLVVKNANGLIQQSADTDSIRIIPDESAILELILPTKIKRAVRGTVSIDAGPDGRGPLRILLTTSRESAVASVVAAETSSREPQLLMALAVIVRTFMISHPNRHATEGFDFCDTTHCQFYRGEQDLSDEISSQVVSSSVARTAGQILRFEGKAVEGYYTAACGGLSVTPSMVWGGTSSYPYTRIACRWCRGSRYSKWERSADAARVIATLSEFIATRLSPATELITAHEQPSGFVESVTIRDGERETVLTADAFRRAIGLRLGWSTVLSPTFTVERKGSRFIFRGRGFGSQVGLCEAGAVAQAQAGRGYREILSFYYPHAKIGGLAVND